MTVILVNDHGLWYVSDDLADDKLMLHVGMIQLTTHDWQWYLDEVHMPFIHAPRRVPQKSCAQGRRWKRKCEIQ